MTDRRPHWDDDLIDAVFRALSHTYRAQGWTGGIGIDLDESVYPLIAAVEDWQAQRLGACVPQLAAWQYEKQTIPLWHWAQAEAAIQRVRELHRNHDDCPDGFEDCAGFGLCRGCGQKYPCPTIRALDGVKVNYKKPRISPTLDSDVVSDGW